MATAVLGLVGTVELIVSLCSAREEGGGHTKAELKERRRDRRHRHDRLVRRQLQHGRVQQKRGRVDLNVGEREVRWVVQRSPGRVCTVLMLIKPAVGPRRPGLSFERAPKITGLA
jgi:hypothetical protein